MVAQRRQVITDMIRRVRLRITEDRIDTVPCQMRTVLVIRGGVFRIEACCVQEFLRRRSQEPVTRIVHVNIRRRALEIVNIRCSGGTYIACVTGNQMRELGIDGEGGRSSGGHPWNLIHGVGQPLQLGLPTGVHTPYRVCQRL